VRAKGGKYPSNFFLRKIFLAATELRRSEHEYSGKSGEKWLNVYSGLVQTRGEFRPRQTRQLPRAVDLKGRLLSCQSY